MSDHGDELVQVGWFITDPHRHDYPQTPCRVSGEFRFTEEEDGCPAHGQPVYILKEKATPSPGDYIMVHWVDDQGEQQSAAGFFDHTGWWHVGDGHVWWVFDWGYAVDTLSDNFRWERAAPPEGQTYTPISMDTP